VTTPSPATLPSSPLAGRGIRRARADRMYLQQGRNSESRENPSLAAKDRPENNCKFSWLRDLRDEIPCAAEQGINSSGTGNRIFENRELNRANRESIPTKRPRQKNGGPSFPSPRSYGERQGEGRGELPAPVRLITRPLTRPLPAKRRGEGRSYQFERRASLGDRAKLGVKAAANSAVAKGEAIRVLARIRQKGPDAIGDAVLAAAVSTIKHAPKTIAALGAVFVVWAHLDPTILDGGAAASILAWIGFRLRQQKPHDE
jgi:hypothetical protein